MRPVTPNGALVVRAAQAISVPLIVIAVWLCIQSRTLAQCTPPCSGPAVPFSRVESDIPGIGAWSSVAICECNNFIVAWERWVPEENQGCPPRQPNLRSEVLAQGYYADGDLFWPDIGILSVQPAGQCHIYHANVSVAMGREGRVWASWIGSPPGPPDPNPEDPTYTCAPIMLQTGFAFDEAPANIVPEAYPIDPCIADNEYWPSTGASGDAVVVGWTKTNNLFSDHGVVQQIDEGTVTQIRPCSPYWVCNDRVKQWQPCVWMREPDESDARRLFAVAWAEPENDDPDPPFNIALQVWDASTNAVIDELAGLTDDDWVN